MNAAIVCLILITNNTVASDNCPMFSFMYFVEDIAFFSSMHVYLCCCANRNRWENCKHDLQDIVKTIFDVTKDIANICRILLIEKQIFPIKNRSCTS